MTNIEPEVRFWRFVDRASTWECWNWTGACTSAGYGEWWDGTGPAYAHRVSYELSVSPIPPGLTIDHLCRNHRCVNPAHLEPVTQRENNARSAMHRRGEVRLAARKEICVNGHAMVDNRRISRSNGRYKSWCAACARERMRRKSRAA